MRCKQCDQYIPEGLGIKQCSCGAELPEKKLPNEKENVLPVNESQVTERKVIERNTKIVTTLLTSEQKTQIIDHINRIKSGIFKKSFIWIILAIIMLLRFILKDDATIFAVIQLICFVAMVVAVIAIFILSKREISRLQEDLIEKKTIAFSVKVSETKEFKVKRDGKKKSDYEIHLEKNEVNIEKVYFYPDKISAIEKGDRIKLTLTPNAHFVLSAELDIRKNRTDKWYGLNS